MGKHRWNGVSRMTKFYNVRFSPSLGWCRIYYFGPDHPIGMVPL